MDKAATITHKMEDPSKPDITPVVHQYGKRLMGFIRKRVVDEADAEDILQDVFYQLIRNNQPVEQLTAWLFRVARNKVADLYRKHKPALLEDLFAEGEDNEQDSLSWVAQVFDKGEDPETLYLRSLFWETLNNALDELPVEQRNIFIWHEMEGFSFKEISERTGERMNTLLSRKRYAILHLRKRLKELYQELLHH